MLCLSAILTLLLGICQPSGINSFFNPILKKHFRVERCITTSISAAKENKIRRRLVRLKDGGDASGDNDSNTGPTSIDGARKSSFEDAQVIGRNLATILSQSCSNGEPMPEEATLLLRALISTTSGARGWFVSLLTDPYFEPVFVPPIDEAFLSALCDNPEPNIKLMTMNVAMPTAMEVTHSLNGSKDLAESSQMTARRASILVTELIDRLPELKATLESLLSAVSIDGDKNQKNDGDKDVKEWIKFCKKWGYGVPEKDAIRKRLESLLS